MSDLREAAQRLVDAYADHAAVHGLARDGFPLGWKAEMDADDALLCALQDTRTALDGRDRPHIHRPGTPEPRVEESRVHGGEFHEDNCVECSR